jgi:hypothetical protein
MANKNSGAQAGDIEETEGDLEETGTPDSTYALISTVYHLLQGAETIGMFIEDAREDGLEEAAEFLEETRDEFIQRAERAKALLHDCLMSELEGEEEEEE